MCWIYKTEFLDNFNKKQKESNNFYDIYDYKNWLEEELGKAQKQLKNKNSVNCFPSEDEKSKKIKSMFLLYFDGCYGIDAVENTSNTFAMGVCKLEYNDNTLTVHLRRPGLLIGKGGCIIDALSKHLKCKIHIVEVNLLK